MDDDAFLAAFEAATLSESQFRHADHVRAAYLILSRHSFGAAIDRMAAGIRNFARAKGKQGLYHETVTVAFMAIVNERIRSGDAADWPAFAAAHPDLFDKRLIGRYYPAQTLTSARARNTFVLAPREAPAERP